MVTLERKKIRQLTKAQLCILFDCTTKSGALDGRKLRKWFMTDDFIENRLNLTKKAYKNIRTFSIKQTKTIIIHFGITDDELKQFL